MAQQSLRGTRLVTQSFETETGVSFVPRIEMEFRCDQGHTFKIPFAHDAEFPSTWTCQCGAVASRYDELTDEAIGDQKEAKAVRTHWDMLRERREIPELEELLNERLTALRQGKFRKRLTP